VRGRWRRLLGCLTVCRTQHVTHCIIVAQEFSGEDNSDLYLEEREQAIHRAQAEKRRIQLNVPGIIGPHDLPEEMQD